MSVPLCTETHHEEYLFNTLDIYKNAYPYEYPEEEMPQLTQNVDIHVVSYNDLQYLCPMRRLQQIELKCDPDILYAVIDGNCDIHDAENDVFYRHSDHLGSANWITDIQGLPIQYIHYAPYGELIANQSAAGYDERYKFTGKERDAESGYDAFGARYYSSIFGHFTSPDPMSDKYPNISPYAYCGWNPVNRIDPDGKLWETAWDIANVGMDIASLKSNVSEGNAGAAVVDGIGLILDGAAMLTPFAPAGAGAIIKAYRTADKVSDAGKATNKFRQAVMRGIQSEKRVLKDMGLTKNTSKIASKTNSGKPINVIPDAVKDGAMYEIKDTKAVYNTSQIQGEYNAAKEAGYEFKIVTGEKTHVSSKIPSDVEIIRRSDLGPQ